MPDMPQLSFLRYKRESPPSKPPSLPGTPPHKPGNSEDFEYEDQMEQQVGEEPFRRPEYGARTCKADVLDRQDHHQANRVAQPHDEHADPFFLPLEAARRVHANRIGQIENEEER